MNHYLNFRVVFDTDRWLQLFYGLAILLLIQAVLLSSAKADEPLTIQSVLAAASDSDWRTVEPRCVAIQIVDLHILGLIDDLPICSLTRIHEIFRHFSLTIYSHNAAAGQGF